MDRPSVSAQPALLRAADDLARTLLPRLDADVRAARTTIEGLVSRLDAAPESVRAGQHEHGWRELERAERAVEAHGFWLGAIAAARGSDLLLARRDRDAWEAARALLSSSLRGSLPAGLAGPRESHSLGNGWELPLCLAVWSCDAEGSSGELHEEHLAGGWRVRARGEVGRHLGARADLVRGLHANGLPLALEGQADAWSLSLDAPS